MAISNNATGIRTGVCTSTTRPTAPYNGQIIYETDTYTLSVWNGSAWVAPTITSPLAIDTKTTSYTLVAGDSGKLIITNSSSANTITVPASVFSVGDTISILQTGTGQTTIAAGASATVSSNGSKLKLYGQFAAATLVCTATNTFVLFGNIAS
jgi:hypothetical protein